MCLWGRGCACECNVPVEARRGCRIPWGRSYTRIPCELPNVGAGNGIWVLKRPAFVLTTGQHPLGLTWFNFSFSETRFSLT